MVCLAVRNVCSAATALVIALVATILACALASSAHAAPNIIFILVDDLRYDDLACTGNDFVATPNFDRLAREGARFTNAFATTPLCSPSRGSILTGQFAHKHGIIDNTERSPASHRLPTFAPVLQKAGYETAFIGKWHMGNDSSPRPGWDHWFCLEGQGTSFDPIVDDGAAKSQRTGYVTDVLNAAALDFVKQKHAKPFCLYLAHKAIHPETYQGPDGKLSDPTMSNFIPAPRHRELYQGARIARRPSYGVPPTDKPALMQTIEGVPPLGPATCSSDEVILNRLRMVSAVDEGLGQLLAELQRQGQLDNTLLVAAGDHGYFYGEHGLSVERRLAYEESIRVPLLVRYPPLAKAGITPEPLVQLIDLAPTFIELAGAPPQPQHQGRSLLPLLRGETPPDWRKSILVEYFSDTVFPRMRKLGYQAARNDRWKYIRYTEQQNCDELYDLEQDPYELHNRIADPAAAAPLATMKAELERLL